MGGIVETSASASGGGGFPVTAFRFVVSDAAGNASALADIAAAIPFYSVNTGHPAVSGNFTYHDDSNQLIVGGAAPEFSLQGTSGVSGIFIVDLGATEALLALSCNGNSSSLAVDPFGNTLLTSNANSLSMGTAGFDVKLGDNSANKFLTLKATTGNVLINKTADNGVDQLQVTGTIFSFNSAAPVGLHMSVGGVLANVIEDAAGNLNLSNSANANGIVLSVGGRTLVNTLTDDGANTLQVNGSLKASSVTIPGLTATRVPFAGSGGTLADSASFTFVSGTGLTLAAGTPFVSGTSATQGSGLKIFSSSANSFIQIGGTSNQTISIQSNAGGLKFQLTGDSTGAGGPANLRLSSDGNISFNSTNTLSTGAIDTNLSRISASLIGVGSSAAGSFAGSLKLTDVFTNDATFIIRTNTTLTNNAAAQIATITNGPTAGNPTKWIGVDDNGTTRFIPAW